MSLQRHNTYYDSANPTSGVTYYDDKGNLLPLTIDKICHPGFGITFSANAIIATGSSSGSGGGSAYSPTVLIEDAGTPEEHPNGGTKVTITDIDHQSGQEFYVWNGNDGTVMNLKEGNGIQITHEAGTTNYTIGVSADYLQSVSVAADGSLAGSGTTNNPLALKTSAENAIKAVSAKSNVDITSAGVTTVTNTSGTTINKFAQYGEIDYHPTPRMFLCATADSQADIVSVLGAASGMGAVVFVVQSI